MRRSSRVVAECWMQNAGCRMQNAITHSDDDDDNDDVMLTRWHVQLVAL